MIIEFGSNKIMKLCTKEEKARKKFGSDVQRILFRRLYELQSFECLEEVPPHLPFRRHKLTGNYKGFFAITIKGPYRIVFKPIIESGNAIEDTPLSDIKRIQIWEVTDYHG